MSSEPPNPPPPLPTASSSAGSTPAPAPAPASGPTAIVVSSGIGSSAGSSSSLNTEQWTVFINQRMSGIPKPTTLPEWQLQAILFKARLPQYYETFIGLGGDDIDQIMTCDEKEFLEIMQLMGMSSKPLHVRRFQRTLQEFSTNREAFLRSAVASIGPPPAMGFPTTQHSSSSSLQAAFQYLVKGISSNALQADVQPSSSSSTAAAAAVGLDSPGPGGLYFLNPGVPSTSTAHHQGPSATANVVPLRSPDTALLSIVGAHQTHSAHSSSKVHSPTPTGSMPGGGAMSPTGSDLEYSSNDPPCEGGILPEADVQLIIRLAKEAYEQDPKLHTLEPRFVQNKKKLPKELLDMLTSTVKDKTQLEDFRKFSAIYGRYDTKRKADKPLSYHELLINEAALQLCALQPVLLTRRDELFPLARLVIRSSAHFSYRTLSRLERKRTHERSQSPQSVTSNRSASPELSRRRDSGADDPPSSESQSDVKRAKSEA